MSSAVAISPTAAGCGGNAGFAADGLSNPDIAGQLLLSHRTISTHLDGVFTELSIFNRRQVGDALAGVR